MCSIAVHSQQQQYNSKELTHFMVYSSMGRDTETLIYINIHMGIHRAKNHQTQSIHIHEVPAEEIIIFPLLLYFIVFLSDLSRTYSSSRKMAPTVSVVVKGNGLWAQTSSSPPALKSHMFPLLSSG